MYERFTDRARKVMQLANEEARSFNHETIGTEHVLLGLIKEGNGVAAYVLKNLEIDLRKTRLEVEKLIEQGSEMITLGKLPQTPRVKKVIECAIEESRNLHHNYVGTEHLLLGLVREREGVGAVVLMNMGVQLEELRNEVLNLLGGLAVAAADAVAPQTVRQADAATSLIAVDIGNSQIKLGQISHGALECARSAVDGALPQPEETLELRIVHETGMVDLKPLAEWCEKVVSADAHWAVASVHRGASQRFETTIASWARRLSVDWPVRNITYREVKLEIRVHKPEKVGIDRLLAAVAANELRSPGRAAIVVDMGTAITVDLVTADGAFAGGAILPGMAISARALHSETDALPLVGVEQLDHAPEPLGKSTVPAIESGVFWGTVGAIRELVTRLSDGLSERPDVFVTGGASAHVAEALMQGGKWSVRREANLVLAGIALVDAQTRGGAGG